jgi:Cytochrome oxidase complex assembly protein 1
MDQAEPTSWFARNRKWTIPGEIFLAVSLLAGAVTVILSFVFGVMKSSEVYKQALAKTRASASVAKALGTPISEGIFVSGSIKISNNAGSADLAIPISGANGKGTVYVVAKRAMGNWTYSKLMVEIDHTRDRIDLLDEPR